MSRSNRMQAAAQRFIDQKQFAGIEWQVNASGADAKPSKIVSS